MIYECEGIKFDATSLVIAALMRSLGVTEIDIDPASLEPPKGLVLSNLPNGGISVRMR